MYLICVKIYIRGLKHHWQAKAFANPYCAWCIHTTPCTGVTCITLLSVHTHNAFHWCHVYHSFVGAYTQRLALKSRVSLFCRCIHTTPCTIVTCTTLFCALLTSIANWHMLDRCLSSFRRTPQCCGTSHS